MTPTDVPTDVLVRSSGHDRMPARLLALTLRSEHFAAEADGASGRHLPRVMLPVSARTRTSPAGWPADRDRIEALGRSRLGRCQVDMATRAVRCDVTAWWAWIASRVSQVNPMVIVVR